MPATAPAAFEHVYPPASIRSLPHLIDLHHSPGAKADADAVDPTPLLRDALGKLRVMQEQLAELSVESARERAIMRESAAETNGMARIYYDLHAAMIKSGLPEHHPVVAMCEDIAAGLEDVAETAALAGSEEFARVIARELADARAED